MVNILTCHTLGITHSIRNEFTFHGVNSNNFDRLQPGLTIVLIKVIKVPKSDVSLQLKSNLTSSEDTTSNFSSTIAADIKGLDGYNMRRVVDKMNETTFVNRVNQQVNKNSALKSECIVLDKVSEPKVDSEIGI